MKPNELSLAHSFGLSNANLAAMKKRIQNKDAPPSVVQTVVPLSAGADAFEFRNKGIAAMFQGKTCS